MSKPSEFTCPNRSKIILIACMLIVATASLYAGPTGPETATYKEFLKAVTQEDEAKTGKLGEELLNQLSTKYADNDGYRTFTSKLTAADYLAQQMLAQLKKNTRERISSAVADILESSDKPEPEKKKAPTSVLFAPARTFYDASITVFSAPVRIDNLTKEEKEFLTQYYNFKLSGLVRRIAMAGQALAVADPNFKGTYDYVLVLPLLHVTEPQSVNVAILPKWLQTPEQLTLLSDSCLLHYDLPYQAMSLAQKAAKLQKSYFTIGGFYETAAGKCKKLYPKTAVDCLNRALAETSPKDHERIMKLHLDIYQVWWDAKDHRLAAAEAKAVLTQYPNHDDYGRVTRLYYTALADAGDSNAILKDIDTALADKRCTDYQAQLLFVKWWSLRRQHDHPAGLAALEDKLLKDFGDNPIVAPIMFAQAMDQLADQKYGRAAEMLDELIEKFPSTKTALQAKKNVEKLKAMKNLK